MSVHLSYRSQELFADISAFRAGWVSEEEPESMEDPQTACRLSRPHLFRCVLAASIRIVVASTSWGKFIKVNCAAGGLGPSDPQADSRRAHPVWWLSVAF
jgi:hypothetical protein